MAEAGDRLRAVAITVGVLALVLIVIRIGSNGVFTSQATTPNVPATPIAAGETLSPSRVEASPTPSPVPSSDCRRPRPWSVSCEGVWTKDLVEAAGYSIVGEGSHAWAVVGGGLSFYLWARPSEEVPANFLDQGGYNSHLEYGEGVVHSNGLAYVWEVEGLYVFAGEFDLTDSTTSVVEHLLTTSLRMAYPPTLPQPEQS